MNFYIDYNNLDKQKIKKIELRHLLKIFKLMMKFQMKEQMDVYMDYQQYSLEIQLIIQFKIVIKNN